ncbi:MAG: NAD(+) synthase [Clostridiales bacterium]|jgi:NAD+ synthase (glutamine-hydrolysing)|nr:NAD(+) synthase [Clostridiales bacterium]
MNYGYVRVAAATLELRVGDCGFNAKTIIETLKEAAGHGAEIIVFPELCVTGYTCGDLFLQESLLRDATDALGMIAEAAAGLNLLTVVGLPYAVDGKLFNCAAVIYEGVVLGLIPKTYLPNYSEFYEARHFIPGPSPECSFTAKTPSGQALFSSATRFQFDDLPEMILSVEICEDLWAVIPPSSQHVQAGATVIANLSASNEITGKDDYRRSLVTGQSASGICAYIYACAGEDESTTDLVFGAHNIIAENGRILAESPRFKNGVTYADIDVRYLSGERRKNTTFRHNMDHYATVTVNRSAYPAKSHTNLLRRVDPAPFAPSDPAARAKRCEEILTLQALGLKKRLKHLNMSNVALGISGGLDSTLALLVCAKAFDLLKLPRSGIHCITMPCFGTSSRTYENAGKLSRLVGGTLREVPIAAAVNQHFSDIGHDPAIHDLTYENSQARERTQVLMDISSQVHGLVVGTGDLSELALGFATYNGDHMSMYGVNASVPKTLIRYLIAYVADTCGSKDLTDVLYAILDTPVSPELLPPEDGVISQKTENILGPYEAHDFFLYHMMRLGFPPEKILYLAKIAFEDRYTEAELTNWLIVFYKRFFANQFKRSCLPDGPKVGSVALSPRGDWRMPSDASVDMWLRGVNLSF